MHAAARWLGGLPLSRGLGSALVLLSWPDGSSRWQGVEGGLAHMEAGLSHLEQGFETGYGSIESGIAEHVCVLIVRLHASNVRMRAHAYLPAFARVRACAPALTHPAPLHARAEHAPALLMHGFVSRRALVVKSTD